MGKFEKAAIKGAALSIKDAGTSKSEAGKILDQPKEVLDNYLNEAAINEWTENYLPSRPDIEGTDAQEKRFVDAFKKELTYQLEKKAGLVRMEIEKAINTVKDEDLQMILTYRYIDWLTWSEIAAKVYYSDKTVRRKHDQAIELIKIDQV